MNRICTCTPLAAVLLCVGAHVSAADHRLADASAQQNRPAVLALLRAGADVNGRQADGATALLWAAHWNDAELVDRLLRARADVNAANDHGVTPLALACENASPRVVETLLAGGAYPDAAQVSGLTPLMIAARGGNPTIVRALLVHGADANAATTITGQTPLMWAIAERHPAVARTLIERGANPHAASQRGFTPLLFAARNGDVEIAELLRAAGVDVNATGSDGTHALPLAIVAGYDEFALWLLNRGGDPNGALGASGVRALHAAAGPVDLWLKQWVREHNVRGAGRRLDVDRRLVLVKALLEHGADPNVRIRASAMPNVQGYLRNGAWDLFAVGVGDLADATPVTIAAYAMNTSGVFPGRQEVIRAESSPDVLRALLRAGADARLRTRDGSTSLMVAAGCGRYTYNPGLRRSAPSPAADEAARILVEDGHVDVNAANEADFTALHCASFAGFNETISYLVGRGADINARDWRGRTPFRLAEGAKQSFQFQSWPETAELLQTLGANTNLGIPGTVHERLRGLPADARDTDAQRSPRIN